MKNSNDTIGNRTRDLPACSAVPQPTAPPHIPCFYYYIILLLLLLFTSLLMVPIIPMLMYNPDPIARDLCFKLATDHLIIQVFRRRICFVVENIGFTQMASQNYFFLCTRSTLLSILEAFSVLHCTNVQCDSFGTRPKKMRISQRLFITF